METLLLALQYFCYVVAPLYTLVWMYTLFLAISYEDSTLQLCDAMKGVKRIYHPMKPFRIALVAWCILIALIQTQ